MAMRLITDAVNYLIRRAAAQDSPSGQGSAVHWASKLRAIESYARFCEQGSLPDYPLEVFLEISNICDLKCGMCVQFSALNPHRLDMIKGTRRGFMNQEDVGENLQAALQHALLVHCFGYGEPTIHPTFRSFLDLVAGYEVMVDFFTNGMHLDDDFCRFLVDRNVYQITVSFSGATKQTYEKVYLGGDFEKVLGGIRALADAKRAKQSAYPIIEINSLGFHDHVAEFDKFVELMADHGVDRVMLKPLEAHSIIPQLYEHVSVMRPEKEGAIVRKALALGRRRGIQVNADLYMRRGAADDDDYRLRIAALKASADQRLGDGMRPFGQNPIADFDKIAAETLPIRSPNKQRNDPKVLRLDAAPVLSRTLLDVETPRTEAGDAISAYCMEPFKTLYVSRNGAAKPCCFGNPNAWYLGDVKRDDALAVWKGSGFEATRHDIPDGKYPLKTCETCLRKKSGPQGHLAQHLINSYLSWHLKVHGGNLRKTLDLQAPAAWRSIGKPAETIMQTRKEWLRERTSTASPADVWPMRELHDAGLFASTANGFVHRDLRPAHRMEMPVVISQQCASAAERVMAGLLFDIGVAHYRGSGSAIDLGMPRHMLGAFLEGVRRSAGYSSMLGAFAAKKYKPVLRYDQESRANDLSGYDELIEKRIVGLRRVTWLPQKPIELILLEGAAKGRHFQQAFTGLAPGLVPGTTFIVLHNFYSEHAVYAKILFGLLSDYCEWLGQSGRSCILRIADVMPVDILAMDPMRDLSADLQVAFHQKWDIQGLSLDARIGLQLSYARLLFEQGRADEAYTHIEQLAARFGPAAPSPAQAAQLGRRVSSFLGWVDKHHARHVSAGSIASPAAGADVTVASGS